MHARVVIGQEIGEVFQDEDDVEVADEIEVEVEIRVMSEGGSSASAVDSRCFLGVNNGIVEACDRGSAGRRGFIDARWDAMERRCDAMRRSQGCVRLALRLLMWYALRKAHQSTI